MNSIDLSILRSNGSEANCYSLSIGYGSAHIVVRLESVNIVAKIVTLISRNTGENKAKWFTVGTFGTCPATLYLNNKEIIIIVDGDDCGDGSSQSFGLHLPITHASEFVEKISLEATRWGIGV